MSRVRKNSLLGVVAVVVWMTISIGSNDALATSASISKKVVLVSGAGGQTGQSLFRQLLELPSDDEQPQFEPIGLVRSQESKEALLASGGIPEANVAIVDVTNKEALQALVTERLEKHNQELAAFCVCTSAKPVPNGEIDETTGRPIFGFPKGQPEVVDWIGQKNQIDVCPPGTHVVLCSTMGGTDPNHPLNNLGRVKVTTENDDNDKDGTTTTTTTTYSGGNIVKWKRKSEVYLMNEKKDLVYTIVHPGGLINEPGGERELVCGIDDDMSYGNTESRTVPRDDVARVMLEALKHPHVYGGRSFDLRAKPVGEGQPTTNFEDLLDSYLEGKNCDYSLGETM